jgi:hypothetical protein
LERSQFGFPSDRDHVEWKVKILFELETDAGRSQEIQTAICLNEKIHITSPARIVDPRAEDKDACPFSSK